MKAITCAVIALVCIVGLAVADYGYGGYAQYVPIQGYGSKGGLGNGGLLTLLGFLFLLILLFRNNNQAASVSVVNLTG